MPKNLVIVESPAKAKTIEKILGPDYIVRASMGHIRDLPKDNAIDIENGFSPSYQVTDKNRKTVAELQKFVRQVDTVWLATDEDREGEAIAWHLYDELDLRKKTTHRFVYHEVTKQAILQAIKNPRTIDYNLVNAQQARRILDRLIGFELSPVLWRKVRRGLSAGRVQSVALRLVVDREREIEGFVAAVDFKVEADFLVGQAAKPMKADLKQSYKSAQEAREFLEMCVDARYVVGKIEVKPGKRSPSAPFTTSTLQQEASRKLGLSIARTMQIAQDLYESGLITYMRTDSVNMSELAISQAKTAIIERYGESFSRTRRYETKSSSAQEAHECIRPTDFSLPSLSDAEYQKRRLYELIWKRAIASQMADAQVEKTIVDVTVVPTQSSVSRRSVAPNEYYQAEAEVLKFKGFMEVYMESSDDESEEKGSSLLPPMNSGDELALEQATAIERYSRGPARYTEATLVKKLEELGIGRPSTYAPTINTIYEREYAQKEDRDGEVRSIRFVVLKDNQVSDGSKSERFGSEKAKLRPTELGKLVTDFLQQHFSQIMDYGFTASVESEFDKIAQGSRVWNEMIGDFYHPFHDHIKMTIAQIPRYSGVRELGVDPVSGKTVSVRLGKFGPIAQIGETGDPEIKFATLPEALTLETVGLSEALNLFKLPRIVGEYEGEPIVVATGKYGAYLKHGAKNYSLAEGDDPLEVSVDLCIQRIESKRKSDEASGRGANRELGLYEEVPVSVGWGRFGPYVRHGTTNIGLPRNTALATITLQEAIAAIDKKREDEKNKIIKEFPGNAEVRVLRGRYGPYIGYGKEFIKIPKGTEPEELTLEQCLELIGEQSASAPKKKSAAGAKKATGADKSKAGAKSSTTKSRSVKGSASAKNTTRKVAPRASSAK